MRLKTLNGAPFSRHLDFTEPSLLAIDKCKAFFVPEDAPDSSETALKWRSLATKNAHLHTGWSQPYLPESGVRLSNAVALLSTPDVEQNSTILEPDTTWQETTMDMDESATAADDYLDHSLMFHDTLLSSQVVQDTDADHSVSFPSFLTTTTSFGTTTSELSSPGGTNSQVLILHVPPKMAISPIGTFPSAQHLRSIYPQTRTPNIICVLMTAPERREVFVRRGGYKMNLYELTVGDDTKAGFKVTFWLRPARESNNEQNHAQRLLVPTLESIRVGDILLLRNIALTAFRDTVYGQSLNPTIARARTTIDVLMKSSGASVGQSSGLPAEAFDTYTKVKKWARTHVATAASGKRKRKSTLAREDTRKRRPGSSDHDESLPPDTLEAL